MDPVTGMIVSSAVGAGIGAGGNLSGSLIQQKAAKKENQRARDFAEYMFKHRYRMARADLEAAGFNPIMAVGGMPGTPGNAPMTGMSGPLGMGEAGVSGAKAGARFRNELKLLQKQVKKVEMEALSAEATAKIRNTETLTAEEQRGTAAAVRRAAEANAAGADTVKALWETNFGKVIKGTGAVLKELNPFLRSSGAGVSLKEGPR